MTDATGELDKGRGNRSAHSKAAYRTHFTRDEINGVLNFCHSIPVIRGFSTAYVLEHYPDRTFNELVGIFRTAGLVVPRGSGTPRCAESVKCLHFNNSFSFLVEYEPSSGSTDG